MPFQVFGPLFSCTEDHDSVHSTLESAASCLAEQQTRYTFACSIHPVTQRHMFCIAAVDRKGNQRNFSNHEKNKAETLRIDPLSLEFVTPSVTTFSHLARIYCEALRQCPLLRIEFTGLFDSGDKDKHYWSTEAGIGHALAYAQQSVFTLELCFKAYLEVLGKLAIADSMGMDQWQTHELTDLYKQLTTGEKEVLENQWRTSEIKQARYDVSFKELLMPLNKSYNKWRYPTDISTTDLRSIELSVDIERILDASDFLLIVSGKMFKEAWPLQFDISTTIISSTPASDGTPSPRVYTRHVEGLVSDIRMPDGFNPYDLVELEIKPDNCEHPIVAIFNKRDAKEYYGLKGRRVDLVGDIREDEPHILRRATHHGNMQRDQAYTTDNLTLQGTVYDIRVIHSAYRADGKVDLMLYDETYFTQVECLFVTTEEQDLLKTASLGDKIQVRGLVTLHNGKPVTLVGPEHIQIVETAAKTS